MALSMNFRAWSVWPKFIGKASRSSVLCVREKETFKKLGVKLLFGQADRETAHPQKSAYTALWISFSWNFREAMNLKFNRAIRTNVYLEFELKFYFMRPKFGMKFLWCRSPGYDIVTFTFWQWVLTLIQVINDFKPINTGQWMNGLYKSNIPRRGTRWVWTLIFFHTSLNWKYG